MHSSLLAEVMPRRNFVTPALPLSAQDFAQFSIARQNRTGSQNDLYQVSTATEVELGDLQYDVEGILTLSLRHYCTITDYNISRRRHRYAHTILELAQSTLGDTPSDIRQIGRECRDR